MGNSVFSIPVFAQMDNYLFVVQTDVSMSGCDDFGLDLSSVKHLIQSLR